MDRYGRAILKNLHAWIDSNSFVSVISVVLVYTLVAHFFGAPLIMMQLLQMLQLQRNP